MRGTYNNNTLSNSSGGLKNAYLTGVRRLKGSSDNDTNDLILRIKYDLTLGKPVEMIEPAGTSTTYEYDNMGRLERIRNNANQSTHVYAYFYSRTSGNNWTFNPSNPNRVRKIAYAGPTRAANEWFDGLGRPIQTHQEDGSDDIISAIQYDESGRMWKQWKPYRLNNPGNVFRTHFGNEVKAWYSSGGDGPNAFSRPFIEARYFEDPLNRERVVLPEAVSSETQSVRYEYGIASVAGKNYQYTLVRDETNRRTQTFTDVWGRTVRTIAGQGTSLAATTDFEYDVMDNLTKVTKPEGDQVTWKYDTRGRLTEKTSADAGTAGYKYDHAGNLRFSQDANQAAAGRVLFTTYDFANRPLVTGEAQGSFSTLTPTSVPSWENTTSNWISVNHYDAKPPTGSFPWNTFSTQISGAKMNSLKGRLGANAFRSDGKWQLTGHGYNANGFQQYKHLFTVTGSGVNTALNTRIVYTYNRLGEVTHTHTLVGSGNNFYQWYEFDNLGNLSKVSSGTSASSPYTDAEYTHWPTGQVRTRKYASGSTVELHYTARDWIRTIGNTGSTVIPFSAEYTYWNNGNVRFAEYRNKGITGQPRYRYSHSYNSLNRLTGATWQLPKSGGGWQGQSAYGEVLSYDRNGNITSLLRRNQSGSVVDNAAFNYQSGNSRISSTSDAAGNGGWIGNMTFSGYDANGNVTSITGNNAMTLSQYDHRNLPLRMTKSDTTSIYRYTAEGQQYYKKVGSGTADIYIMDGDRILGVFTENGSRIHWNIHGPDLIGRLQGTSTRRYYHKDHLGSVRAVSTTGNTVMEAHDYYPFGLIMPGRSLAGSPSTRERFTGKERDFETRFDYFGARYYFPNIGRWMSVDPLADDFAAWSPYNQGVDEFEDHPFFLLVEPVDEPDLFGTLNRLASLLVI